MKFSLIELPYAHNALEPIISEKTISFHYGKHHQTYVNNLNGLVGGTEFEDADLETIVKNRKDLFSTMPLKYGITIFTFYRLLPKREASRAKN